MGIDKNNPNMAKIMSMIGNRLGADPKVLQQQLEEGRYDSVFQKMNPNDAAKLQQILNNPQLAQQVINTPQAKQVLKNFVDQANPKK